MVIPKIEYKPEKEEFKDEIKSSSKKDDAKSEIEVTKKKDEAKTASKKGDTKGEIKATTKKDGTKSSTKETSDKSTTKDSDESEEKTFSFKEGEIRILTREMIEKLLNKSIEIDEGSTSIVYKVKNIFEPKCWRCLKILKSEVFKRLKEPKEDKKIEWGDDDDDDDEYIHDEKTKQKYQIDIDVIKTIYQEFEILDQLNHKNIIKVFGFYPGDPVHNPAILLEYCKYNLEEAIKNLDDLYLVAIIYEICSAMKYVHEKGLIHRDLKMRNILINSEKHAKICDFGISKAIDIETIRSLTHGVGTIAFMAPELFNEDIKYNEKVDVYAFGVVMHFILTKGQYPKLSSIGNYEHAKIPSCINGLSKKIIKKCWAQSPDKRPSFSKLTKYIRQKQFLLIDGIEDQIPALLEHLGLK